MEKQTDRQIDGERQDGIEKKRSRYTQINSHTADVDLRTPLLFQKSSASNADLDIKKQPAYPPISAVHFKEDLTVQQRRRPYGGLQKSASHTSHPSASLENYFISMTTDPVPNSDAWDVVHVCSGRARSECQSVAEQERVNVMQCDFVCRVL